MIQNRRNGLSTIQIGAINCASPLILNSVIHRRISTEFSLIQKTNHFTRIKSANFVISVIANANGFLTENEWNKKLS
jgi:hypothetical protein